MPDLTTDFAGVRLRNPVVAAPAAITENADRLKRCEDAGCGAAVIKSYFEYELGRHSPTPRFKVIRHKLGKHRAFTLYSYEQANVAGLDEFCEEIARAKAACDMPIFASLNCNTDERWLEGARAVAQAGADAIELNASCPHGTHMMAHLALADVMAHAVEVTRSACDVPVIPKVTPQLDNPNAVVRHLAERNADGVVMFNRFTGLDIDAQAEAPVMHGAYAGHGGPWALQYVLLAGATTTQTCTAIVMEGYGVVARLLAGLEQFMEDKGYQTIDEFRGKACRQIVGNDEVDRVGRRHAAIDADECINCGLCERVCIYGAPHETEGHRAIAAEACDGCGLCVELCPVPCIQMVDREVPRTFELGVK